MQAAVDMGAEGDALVRDVAQLGLAQDLKTARVGEDHAVVAHEAVQAAGRAYDLDSGAQVEVVAVGEDGPGAERGQVLPGEGLDGGLCRDGHEDRGLDLPVRGLQDSRAGLRAGVFRRESEAHGEIVA